MDMKAKSSLIRTFRSKRMWSQEQLALACGLGLRTIQRVETRGSASTETIKALASVFEVDAMSLVWQDGDYQVYKHKQWSVVILALMPILFSAIIINSQFIAIPASAMGVLFALLTIVTFVFSSMTIEVNEIEIKWFFGPGLFRKSLNLEKIGSYKTVRNPIWMGFGIHAFGTGWIYNVSGLLGIEIELKSGASIRLGTDEPNYLVAAIDDAQANIGVEVPSKKSDNGN